MKPSRDSLNFQTSRSYTEKALHKYNPQGPVKAEVWAMAVSRTRVYHVALALSEQFRNI